MAIKEAPKAVETKSRREKDGLAFATGLLSSIACSFDYCNPENKTGVTSGCRLAARMDALVL
jgi:hypothetical protein